MNLGKQFVKDLKENDRIQSVFLVHDKQLLKDRKGNSYLNLNLGDKSGFINARLWDRVHEIAPKFDCGDYINVKGHVQIYQNKRQVIIHDLEPMSSSQLDVSDFFNAAERPFEEMYAELLHHAESMQDGYLKKLTLAVIADPELKERLLVCPAAKSIHHAYPGGLLEHIVSLCRLMSFVAGHYTFLNRDWLLFGAIFHDIGKLWEFEFKGQIQYTDAGRLVGHMAIACELIDKKAGEIENFPTKTKDLCKHIVLSHHGKYEYGSPKAPKTLEAYVVSAMDEFDSRLNQLSGYMKRFVQEDVQWTDYHQSFDRYFYLDVLKEKLAENK